MVVTTMPHALGPTLKPQIFLRNEKQLNKHQTPNVVVMKITRTKPSYIIYNKQTIVVRNTLHITINCQNFVVYCFQDDGVISSILRSHAPSTFHHKMLILQTFFWG
jgi:hypothetical protein